MCFVCVIIVAAENCGIGRFFEFIVCKEDPATFPIMTQQIKDTGILSLDSYLFKQTKQNLFYPYTLHNTSALHHFSQIFLHDFLNQQYPSYSTFTPSQTTNHHTTCIFQIQLITMDQTEAYTKTQLKTIQTLCSFVINQMEKETSKDIVEENLLQTNKHKHKRKKAKRKEINGPTNGTHTPSQHDTPNKQ